MAGHGIDQFQHRLGETLATTIAAAYAAKEPWFGYYRAPTSVLGKYPMVHVETAPFVQSAHTCNGEPECAASILSAYPTAKIPSLLEREPKLVEFLKLMSVTNDHMGALLAWQDENSASYEGAAAIS